MGSVVPLLIVAWGNVGRRDDGVALVLLERLHAVDWLPPGTRLAGHHQLGPEIAADIAAAGRVVFIDAHVDPRRADLAWESVVAEDAGLLDSHHCEPRTLLALCRALDWPVPTAQQLAVRASDCDLGDALSDRTAALVEPALDLLRSKLAAPVPSS